MTKTPAPSAVHARTPGITVIDPRSLGVRSIAYHRAADSQAMEARITSSRHTVTARETRHWDPRLAARLAAGNAVPPNQATLSSLCGQVLLEENADAGWRLSLYGEAGQTLQRWDGRGSHWVHEYDGQLRPLSVHESPSGEPPRVAERYAWGAAWEQEGNRCGRLLRHDDDAGSCLLNGYGLTGQVTAETRHFLASLDLPDWPAAMEDRDALLEPGAGALTRYRHNPAGELLEHTDAGGNRQRTQVNLAGELTGLEVVLADGATHPLLVDACYNAFGQAVGQTAGNGVISHCEYDPASQRLTRMTARRPQRGVLLDLHYGYDPVGNVLHSEDLSQPTRHFANQKIEPRSTFSYDSLYQLSAASGREVSTGAGHGPALPGLEHLPADQSRMTNYTRHYHYDAAGNLSSLRHLGSQPFTRDYRIAADSNRCLPPELRRNRLGDAFDANGNLRQLLPGQTLHWNLRNQLHALSTVQREGESDAEQYRYAGDGKRCRKTSSAQAGGRRLVNEVRYLPGLEMRRTASGEVLQVITAISGLGEVRVLHWQAGKPDGIDNDQIRYSLGDHLGSSTLELDQQAGLISQELYYPFGGTAWWAGRSAIEASYKTVRYSGKERDASGLYDYGLRYYAPWLQRWLNPDPAGDVDGLNRYRMVGNNPVSFFDDDGLVRIGVSKRISDTIAALNLEAESAQHDLEAALRAHPLLHPVRTDSAQDTQEIIGMARRNSATMRKMPDKAAERFARKNPGMVTEVRLERMVAHATASWMDNGERRKLSGYTNFVVNLSPGKVARHGMEYQQWESPHKNNKRKLPWESELPSAATNLLRIVDPEKYIALLKSAYQSEGEQLHPLTERWTRQHIKNSHSLLFTQAGAPGAHAEVRVLNAFLFQRNEGVPVYEALSGLVIHVKRLVSNTLGALGEDFPACSNCSGIIPQWVTVTSRRTTPFRLPSPPRSSRSSPAKSPGPR